MKRVVEGMFQATSKPMIARLISAQICCCTSLRSDIAVNSSLPSLRRSRGDLKKRQGAFEDCHEWKKNKERKIGQGWNKISWYIDWYDMFDMMWYDMMWCDMIWYWMWIWAQNLAAFHIWLCSLHNPCWIWCTFDDFGPTLDAYVCCWQGKQ